MTDAALVDAPPPPTRVCLFMIVKDEIDVIARCLASVKPYVASWCIVDTGSTDGTQDAVRAALADVPGVLHERPWRDFGHNRSEAMRLARDVAAEHDCAWLFTLDADETLIAPQGWTWPTRLDAHAYEVRIVPEGAPDFVFTRHLLFRASAPWRYEGALHEDCVLEGQTPEAHGRGGRLPGVAVLTRRDGARQKNPRKYLDDAELIKREMSRNAFYLAQSYRDHWQMTGDTSALEQALDWYERRAGMRGWDQETWRASFEYARCLELLRRPPGQVIEAYLAAHANRPHRAESLHALAEFFRRNGYASVARVFDAYTRGMRVPGESMYVEGSAYGGPRARIAVITAPRPGGATLHHTLRSAVAADAAVWPDAIRVFADMTQIDFVRANVELEMRVPVSCENEAELARRREAGGIYGTLNLARALAWAGEGGGDVAVTLEDDVMFSRLWLDRAIALLEAVERDRVGPPVVVSLHDMHYRDALGPTPAVRVGEDAAFDWRPSLTPNGSQGYAMRPATASMLAAVLRERMGADALDDRRAWAMDVGMTRACVELGLARLVFADPCLLVHVDEAPSTWATGDGGLVHDDGRAWTDDEHRRARTTKRFRAW